MSINKTQPKPEKKRRWLWVATAVILIGLLLVGINWATYARPPLPAAVAALESNVLVEVAQDPWLTFTPAQTVPTTGFIFYPGGRIDPQGYAPLMQAIAAEGYQIVVPEMPINMAVFQPNIADEIMAAYPEIDQWAIGGHSVGGTMAAQYTHEHPELIDGLVIWASYPADNADLSDFNLPVALIYGSLDPRVNADAVMARQHLLPPDTVYTQIEGGDHHQFGAYKIEPEEHFATIAADDQQQQIIQATLNLLGIIKNPNPM